MMVVAIRAAFHLESVREWLRLLWSDWKDIIQYGLALLVLPWLWPSDNDLPSLSHQFGNPEAVF